MFSFHLNNVELLLELSIYCYQTLEPRHLINVLRQLNLYRDDEKLKLCFRIYKHSLAFRSICYLNFF